ncbi:hypothetical protein EON65_02665 [archaeon]|nr:MAG: hypothetical protein EON65_02665 [archaeon]
MFVTLQDWPRALGEAIPHRKQQKRKKDANMDDEKEACSNDVAVLSGSNAEEHVVEEVVGEHDGVSSR